MRRKPRDISPGDSDLKQLLNNNKKREKREEGLKLSSVFLMAFAGVSCCGL